MIERMASKSRRPSGRKAISSVWAEWDYVQANDWAGRNDWIGPEGEAVAEDVKEAIALRASDPEKSLQALLAFAERGSVWSMIQVAHSYKVGWGTPVDPLREEDWYRRAFEAGSERALLDYGAILFSRGALDLAEAVYEAGAGKGWAPAMCHLARLRLKRPASREGHLAIYSLLESAREQGSPAALWFLARYMARGYFGVHNIPKGVALAFKAGETMRELVDGETPIKRAWTSMRAGTA